MAKSVQSKSTAVHPPKMHLADLTFDSLRGVPLTPALKNVEHHDQANHQNTKGPAHPPAAPKSVVIKVYERNLHFSVFSQWPEKRLELENAPEVIILVKQPPTAVLTNESYLAKLLGCFGAICKNRVHSLYGLSNFKPLVARTNETFTYVEKLIDIHKSHPASLHGIPDAAKIPSVRISGKGKMMEPPPVLHVVGSKDHLLQEFYQVCHRSLQYLQNGITLYKQIILSLSFTLYAEEALTTSEIKLSTGKSIVGSCMWVIAYAIDQLRADPDVQQVDPLNTRTENPFLMKLGEELLSLIRLSFSTWREMVRTIGVLERVHRKTELLFHRQTYYFKSVTTPESENAIEVGIHLKKYRRAERDSNPWKFGAPPATSSLWGKKHCYPRILYKTQYSKPDASWKGFDPLSVKSKVGHLTELIHFVRLILHSVAESARKLVIALEGVSERRHIDFIVSSQTLHAHQKNANTHHVVQPPFHITCYEEGIEAMDELLSKKLAHIDWNAQEIREFFETDKIFLDDMDLLTLGANVTRALLHTARHTIHLCYEASRLTGFKEFVGLPNYLEVYKKVKESPQDEPEQDHKASIASASSKKSTIPNSKQGHNPPPKQGNHPPPPAQGNHPPPSTQGNHPPTPNQGNHPPLTNHAQKQESAPAPIQTDTRTSFIATYDIEEDPLDLKNVPSLLRTSPYYELVKELPIYCNAVGITLQDAELVFTPSSEKLLSK